MLRLISSILLAATLAPASPYGISIPAGEKPALTEEIPALRYFPSWETLQPTPGKWNMQPADDLIAAAQKSGTEVFGILHAPTDEDAPSLTENKEVWRTYVATLASRYAKDITYWEVLPSYSITHRNPDAPYHYAQLLKIARETARKSHPSALIGFSLPDYDLEFLDRSLRDGAEGQFDYICIAPFPVYHDTDSLFLRILPRLRDILVEYGMDEEMPIYISLTGSPTTATYYARLASENGYTKVFLPSVSLIPEDPEPDDDSPIHSMKTYADEDAVSATFGENPTNAGLYHLVPSSLFYDKELKATRLAISAHPPVTRAAFFAPDIDTGSKVEITVTAKRLPSETQTQHPSGFRISYESIYGIRNHDTWWTIPGGDDWQTNTWTITDADFTGKYAWNFRLDASGAGNDLLLKEVTLKAVSD